MAKIPVIVFEYRPGTKEFYRKSNRCQMDNILLRFCRYTQGHTPEVVAAHLSITVGEYYEIETGKTLLTAKQARKLGKLFNAKTSYFYEAARKLDLLLARDEMIKIQKEKIGELKKQVQDLQKIAKR